jgi:hypothetical protein
VKVQLHLFFGKLLSRCYFIGVIMRIRQTLLSLREMPAYPKGFSCTLACYNAYVLQKKITRILFTALTFLTSFMLVADKASYLVYAAIDDRALTVTQANLLEKREALIRKIWGTAGYPISKTPTVVTSYIKTDEDAKRHTLPKLSELPNLSRIDQLKVTVRGSTKSLESRAYHFIPQNSNGRLMIVHHGHSCVFNDYGGLTEMVKRLLEKGYGVVGMRMPGYQDSQDCPFGNTEHNILWTDPGYSMPTNQGSQLKYFIEPVAVVLNYMRRNFPNYKDYNLTGLSGGGWTTTIYAAIDPNLHLSFPVRGTLPLYMKSHYGDTEQHWSEYFAIAGYPDHYALGSFGIDRKQVQVMSYYDAWFGYDYVLAQYKPMENWNNALRDYETRVNTTLRQLGAGIFEAFIETPVPEYRHQYAPDGINKIMKTLDENPPGIVKNGGSAFSINGGWTSQHLRLMADVNGDRRADIVGFKNDGVYVSTSKGNSFNSENKWISKFGSNDGWSIDAHPRFAVDVTGDSKADIVGFAADGVYVAASTGASFNDPVRWVQNYGTNNGWGLPSHPRFMADVTGDKKADVVGFANDGVYVSVSTGSSFTSPQCWVPNFGANNSWDGIYHPRIMADVNGDKKADVVGFANDGVWVSISTGSTFKAPVRWYKGFGLYSEAGGWDATKHLRLMGDIDGNGSADIVGFGNDGVYIGLSKILGSQTPVPDNSFAVSRWRSEYGYNTGWGINAHPRILADVNGDKRMDIVGFASDGTYVSFSMGNALTPPKLVVKDFNTGLGWTVKDHPRFASDLDGDGTAEIIGCGHGATYFAKPF